MLEQLEIYLIPCNDPPFAMMAATLASPCAHIKLSKKTNPAVQFPFISRIKYNSHLLLSNSHLHSAPHLPSHPLCSRFFPPCEKVFKLFV